MPRKRPTPQKGGTVSRKVKNAAKNVQQAHMTKTGTTNTSGDNSSEESSRSNVVSLHDGARRVTLLKDTTLTFPDLYLDVYVEGPESEARQFAEMFVRSHCSKAETIDKADLVIFTGGEDVDPSLYGEKPHSSTRANAARDMRDMKVYEKCLNDGIPMFGVCRGAQFLAVMQGAKLYQDVNNHYGEHTIYDIRGKCQVGKVSSVHHQMVIPHPEGGMEVLATSGVATYRWKNDKDKVASMSMSDVEAYFYRDACILGVQGHPEYRGYHGFAKWTLDLINELIVSSPDTVLINNQRRLDPDFLAQRELRWKEKVKERQAGAN